MTVEPGLQLMVRPIGPGLIEVVGELDIRTCQQLEQVAGPAVDTGDLVVLELSRLTFCDSTGLAVFVRLHKRAQAAGGALVARAPVPRVANLFTVTGLNRLFAVEP